MAEWRAGTASRFKMLMDGVHRRILTEMRRLRAEGRTRTSPTTEACLDIARGAVEELCAKTSGAPEALDMDAYVSRMREVMQEQRSRTCSFRQVDHMLQSFLAEVSARMPAFNAHDRNHRWIVREIEKVMGHECTAITARIAADKGMRELRGEPPKRENFLRHSDVVEPYVELAVDALTSEGVATADRPVSGDSGDDAKRSRVASGRPEPQSRFVHPTAEVIVMMPQSSATAQRYMRGNGAVRAKIAENIAHNFRESCRISDGGAGGGSGGSSSGGAATADAATSRSCIWSPALGAEPIVQEAVHRPV